MTDLSTIPGLESARRALEVAAAGGHNLHLVGPPGTGKRHLISASYDLYMRPDPPVFDYEPCLCGNFGDKSRECVCDSTGIDLHHRWMRTCAEREPGLWAETYHLAPSELAAWAGRTPESTAGALSRITAARARLPIMHVNPAAERFLDYSTKILKLPAWEVDTITSTARTIARLANRGEGRGEVEMADAAEAVGYRFPFHRQHKL